MSAAEKPEDEFPENPAGDDEDDEEVVVGARCPLCELLAGECDHLVASIDLTYSEFVAGTIFAHERAIFDLMEHLAASDPDALKVAGGGPALEHLASLVKAEVEEGASPGDAVAIHFPRIMAAISHMLQEDEDVTTTEIDAASADGSSVENLWAREPEWIVDRLIERLESLVEEMDEEAREEGSGERD